MPSWVLDVTATVVISTISAFVFLRLRCRGVGNPFGARARWWSIAIVAMTVVVSTALGLGVVSVSHHIRAAYIGLILPSALWLGRTSVLRDEPRGNTPQASVINFLTFPLRRLNDSMGVDMQEWCDIRSRAVADKPAWVSDAAQYYHRQVAGRVKDEPVKRKLLGWRESIEHKIWAAEQADRDDPGKLRAALQSHPSTRNMRKYSVADSDRLAARLRTEAENELHLFLFALYQLGFYDLLVYPFRPPALPRKRRR